MVLTVNYQVLAYTEKSDYFMISDTERFWKDNWYIVLIIALAVAALIFITVKLTQYFVRSHTVILCSNGENTQFSVKHGQSFLAPVPQTDKVFKGWFRDTALTIPFNSSDRILRDTILYAKFE